MASQSSRRRRLIRRTNALIITLTAILLLASATGADLTGAKVAAKPASLPPQSADRQSSTARLEQAVFELINQIRLKAGLAPVKFAADLQTIARAHSEDQARRNVLTHRSADGRGPGERLDAARIAWLRYGENVALVKGYSEPARAVVEAWLASPAHAANLLNPDVVESAVGVAQAADGTYFLTQEFVSR
ncbi:MAG: CAP domain-containing protein [Candidatus Zipacnadales bacterium]